MAVLWSRASSLCLFAADLLFAASRSVWGRLHQRTAAYREWLCADRVRFGQGSLTIQSQTFGIRSQRAGDRINSSRQMQLGLKMYFWRNRWRAGQ
jgi:hypothetical protein